MPKRKCDHDNVAAWSQAFRDFELDVNYILFMSWWRKKPMDDVLFFDDALRVAQVLGDPFLREFKEKYLQPGMVIPRSFKMKVSAEMVEVIHDARNADRSAASA